MSCNRTILVWLIRHFLSAATGTSESPTATTVNLIGHVTNLICPQDVSKAQLFKPINVTRPRAYSSDTNKVILSKLLMFYELWISHHLKWQWYFTWFWGEVKLQKSLNKEIQVSNWTNGAKSWVKARGPFFIVYLWIPISETKRGKILREKEILALSDVIFFLLRKVESPNILHVELLFRSHIRWESWNMFPSN